MAGSTAHLRQLSSTQAGKEILVNALLAALSQSSVYGRDEFGSSGLTWAYFGGVVDVAGVPTVIANGSITLTGSATNYVRKLDSTGVVSSTTSEPTDWPAPNGGYTALYEVVTSSSAATSWEDYRLGVGVKGDTGATGAAGSNWSVSVNAQTGTTYTLQASDNGKVITCSNASSITVTVPSGLGANFACQVIQIAAGTVTFSASGVTLNSFQSLTSLAGQHASGTLVAYVADVFNLSGNLA